MPTDRFARGQICADTGDAGAAKKRQEAIEALTKIEIEFAQLRDKMYLEKMEEIARERWQIENGE